jgi:predicted secreted protein
MKIFIFLVIFSVSGAFAASKQKIDVLGSSGKGQFVALEEYGYKPGTHMYFVKIRIMNMWKEEYVGDSIQIELPATRPYVLKKARKEALELAQNTFKKYNISP